MAKIPFDIKYRPQIESSKYKVIYLSFTMKEEFPTRIICWDRHNEYSIVALISNSSGYERVEMFQKEGIDNNNPHIGTLFIVTPEEELTEWQRFISACLQKHGLLDCGAADRIAKESATELLSLAREQFIKDGYVIEKKAFHDAAGNISDKHLAEMSVEYSIYCKVEDGTLHAVINWNEFQKVAQHFIDCGKAEALKEFEEKYKQSWFNEGKIAGRFEGLTEEEKYQQGIHDGKEEALKDLPRWKKCNFLMGTENAFPRYIVRTGGAHYSLTSTVLKCDEYIPLSELAKLPVSKEDENDE